MRLATVVEDGRPTIVVVRDGRFVALELPHHWRPTMREVAGFDADELRAVREWADEQPDGAYRPIEGVVLGPAVPDPGAIYTIGLNYHAGSGANPDRPERPLVYGKLPSSMAGHGATLTWDRKLTPNVDAEVELGVVIGQPATAVAPEDALRHIFGYTIVDDVSSRDEWLDGDQWLLGKSMAGFCPVGPWVVTPNEIEPDDLRLGCTINGIPIQDGSTAAMRFSIEGVIAFLSRHVTLRPGDLIATGTPARLEGPLGPDRHLEPGDVVTCWIEGIGELTTRVA
ncbi:MAG TPA: fumarylacetoacetate hydrolase family protein [Candidatus Limnocylindrales bacterium]|nr:fumarylacetoacetate hydrolase family protein [Candidatus Limnocylindrales bacterium]